MSDHLHDRQYLHEGDIAVLNCDTQCNFFLVDDSNYNRYKRGDRFEYYGNFYKYFPAKIGVPHTGYWNVVIDLGGGRANISYNLSYIKR